MINWTLLDRVRRRANPVERDLIEAHARGAVNRRDFIKRGTVIGLSVPAMTAVLAACGDSDDSTPSTTTGGAEAGGGAAAGGSLIVANQFGDANSGLDPVNMLDLGTYNVISQSFEYLVGLGSDGNIDATALATSWEPNEDGSQWSFTLREGVMWQDGTPLTSADVAATMDRLAAANNAALGGVIGEGSVDASDPAVAVFTLLEPNGNFPVLVSIFNPQSVITPADYSSGTTLDERPAGTGAWILSDFNAAEFVARFERNPNWWGGETPLDAIELRGFSDIGTAVTAMQSRQIDVIQNFSVIGGEGLLDDANFTVLTPPSSNHRQVWFHVSNGQFTDKLVRQAMAWTFDRQQMVDVLFSGRAEIANDHPVLSSLPFFDAEAVPQRSRDIDQARALLAEAGVEGLSATLQCGDLGEVPDLAGIIQQNAAEAGFDLQVNVQSNSTFYGDSWCPGGTDEQPCADADEFGIVDYGHRPIPDVFFSSALASGGVWNSSNFANSDFDTQLTNYRAAIDVDGQKTAISEIQKILWDEVPASYPYFFNFLAGHDASVSGVQATSLGHVVLSGASKSA
ncbi:MAG: ABC transporter substrate-binding protein [Actinomycetota bacterium]